MMSSSSILNKVEPTRLVSFLPTVKEVQTALAETKSATEFKSPPPFLSDHAPIISEVKVAEGSIRLMSFNMHAHDPNSSGCAAEETDQQIIHRGKHTIDFIIQQIIDQKLDAVLLQEAYLFDSLLSKRTNNELQIALSAALKKIGWEFVEGDGSQNRTTGFLTLYNRNKFKCYHDKINIPANLSFSGKQFLKAFTQPLQFIHIESGKYFKICNVHWRHEEIPRTAEETLPHLTNSIVMGDFNCRLLIPGKKYLPTNTVNPQYRTPHQQQGVDFTDGVFVVDEKGEPTQQFNIHVVNLNTGKIQENKFPEEKFSKEQKYEMERQRVFLAVSKEFRMQLEASVMPWHRKVLSRYNDITSLRQTTNAKGETGLALVFDYKKSDPKKLIQFLNRFKLPVAQHDDFTGQVVDAVFFPTYQLDEIVSAIKDDYFNYLKNISTFEQANAFLDDYLSRLTGENPQRATILSFKERIEGWMKNGVVEENPFSQLRQEMQTLHPKAFSGFQFSLFTPSATKIFNNLVKLDRELISLPTPRPKLEEDTIAFLKKVLHRPEDKSTLLEKKDMKERGDLFDPEPQDQDFVNMIKFSEDAIQYAAERMTYDSSYKEGVIVESKGTRKERSIARANALAVLKTYENQFLKKVSVPHSDAATMKQFGVIQSAASSSGVEAGVNSERRKELKA